MHYFKFHHEAMSDSKVQTLAPETFRAWVNILCMASANKPRGFLPPMKQVSYILHVPIDEATRIVNELMAEGLVDSIEGQLRPHNWDARQGREDKSAERTRRYRKRTKEKLESKTPDPPILPDPDGKPDVTRHERVTNRDVTNGVTNGDVEQERKGEEKRRENELTPNVVNSARDDDDADDDLANDDEDYNEAAERLGYQVISRGHRKTIEHTRSLIGGAKGDECAVAVGHSGMRIHQHLGGGWKYFRAAAETLKRSGKGKHDYVWAVLFIAKDYRSTGIPPPPVAVPDDPSVVHPRIFPAGSTSQPPKQNVFTRSAAAFDDPRPDTKERA